MIDFTEAMINTSVLGMLANTTMNYLQGAVPVAVDGVFRKPSDVLLGDLIQGDQPTFIGLTSQIGSLAYGAAVAVSAVNFTVARNEPDGTGVTVLTLQKV